MKFLNLNYYSVTLRKKCQYSELFWSAFSHIWTEYGEIVRMQENGDQNNSEYGHFSRSVRRDKACFYVRLDTEEGFSGKNMFTYFMLSYLDELRLILSCFDS